MGTAAAKTSGKFSLQKVEVIALGSSAGGIEALKSVLPFITADFPVAVVVVQHIGNKSATTLVPFFQAFTGAIVKEVEDKEVILPGRVYFAPAGYHVLTETDGVFSLSVDDPVGFSRPSIDVMMESVADAYRDRSLGIVMTGANQDGAEGLAAIAAVGGMAIVQDPKTASFPAMPEAALRAVPAARIMSLAEIGEFLGSVPGLKVIKEI